MDQIARILRWPRGSTVTWTVRAASRLGDPTCAGRPLVVVHGGPGLPHQYLRSLAGLARPDRPVIFYDQLGCGRSQLEHRRPTDAWSLSIFVEELGVVIRSVASDYGQCDILAHSSGGWIAVELLVCSPSVRSVVRRLVLGSTPLDIPAFVDEQAKLIGSLRWSVRRRLKRPPPCRSRGSQTYWRAYQEFLRLHVCRVTWPPELVDAMRHSNRDVYRALWGPSEVWVTGSLKSWSRAADADRLSLPILLTSGRHDEVTPELVATAHDALPCSQWRLFDNSAHMAHIEEPEAYLDAIDIFLTQKPA